MHRSVLAGVCMVALGLCGLPAGGAPENGRPASASPDPRLDGVWVGYVVEGRGENPNGGPVHLELTIKGDQIKARDMSGKQLPMTDGTYKVAPGNPPQMDGTNTRPNGRTQTYLGIYSVEGDTLKWCVANPNKDRPTAFEIPRTGGGQFLLILRKQLEKATAVP